MAAGETRRREKPAASENADEGGAAPAAARAKPKAVPATDAPPPGAGGKAAEIARLKIPGYEILDLLGKGGMGAVYKARQKSLDRIVALKVLAPDIARDETYLKRFTTEARALARLNHENIIAGIDVGEANGYRYFAMEYVEGESLAALIEREGALSEKRALTIAMQIARALAHADKNGLVHRDVKPQNVMIGRSDVAKLCDLGLAMTADERKEARDRGQSIGTPHYISPEQARGEHRVDIRSDIYSLGATLYHAVTGETPFSGSSPMVLMTKHLTEDPVAPRKRNPRVGKALDALIVKMLAKEKERRYQTPTELLEDMERILAGRGIEGGGAAAGSGAGRAAAKAARPARAGAPAPARARAAAGGAAKRRPSREDDDGEEGEEGALEEERPHYVRKKADASVMGLLSIGVLLVAGILGWFIFKNATAPKEVVAPPPSQETEDRARESLANIRRAVARKDTDKYGAIRLVDQLIVQFDRTAAAKDAVEYRKVLEAMPLEKDGEEAPAPAGDDAPAPDRPPAADAPGAGE
jgi:tRNA A-37 threonylcarbamoyl transferase component Bud32